MKRKRQILLFVCCGVSALGTAQTVRSPWSLRPDSVPAALPVGSGFTPFNIEIEDGTSTNPSRVGANLYPRSLDGSDPVLAIQQFPLDELSVLLGFRGQVLANTPVINADMPRLFDWVRDTLPNSDAPSLQSGLASGIIPGITGTGYMGVTRGHWNGLRIVDGVANNEQDMFLKGGKEDDTLTWTIGAGSVGSGKYDITQAYIANTRFVTADVANFPSGHRGIIYLALERRSNVGTTVYDVEFNLNPPITDYLPSRSEGDILITLVANGSGTGGSAETHVYIYHNGDYLNHELLPSSLPFSRRPLAMINQVVTPSAPWGYVNEKGVWEIGQIPNFCLIEAAIPFGVDFMQGINFCSGAAYVQVRSRSSVSASGTMKDITRCFRYQFNEPLAVPHGREYYQQVGSQWLPTDQLEYDGTESLDSFQGRNLNMFHWKFKVTDPRIMLVASVQGLRKIDDSTYELETATGDPSNLGFSLPTDLDESTLDASLEVLDFTGCFSDGPGRKGFKIIKRANRPIYNISAYRENGTVTLVFTASGGKPPFDVRMKFKNTDGSIAFEDLRTFTAEGTYLCEFPDSLLLDGVEVTVNDRVVADDDGGPKGYVPIVPKI